MTQLSKAGWFFQTKPHGYQNEVKWINASTGTYVVKVLALDEMAEGTFHPNIRMFGRWYNVDDAQEHAQWTYRGRQGADDYFNHMRGKYEVCRSRGWLDVFGTNEAHPNQHEIAPTVEFEQHMATLVGNFGMRYWMAQHSVGTPGLVEAGDAVTGVNYLPAVRAARQTGGGVALHEYGAPAVNTGNGYWTLRYRKYVRELYDAGLEPGANWIFIGEMGIDGGLINKPKQGWQFFTSSDDYLQQLDWYDREVMKDPEVLVWTGFISNPLEEWKSYNCGPEYTQHFANKHQGGSPPSVGQPPTQPPVIDPPPVQPPSDVEARLQLAGEYLIAAGNALVDQGASRSAFPKR